MQEQLSNLICLSYALFFSKHMMHMSAALRSSVQLSNAGFISKYDFT